jgi:hypothetical protein
MKIYELAKEHQMKVTDFLKLLKDLGYPYNSTNTNVTQEEVDSISADLNEYFYVKQFEIEQLKSLSNARFLGVLYNKNTKKYERMILDVDMLELSKIMKNLKILGEHDNIYGVKIVLANDIMKNILTKEEFFK